MRLQLLVAMLAAISMHGAASAQPASAPPGKLVPLGGRKVHLFCEGTGGPTVVIETGSSTPASVWRGVQDRIAEFERVCTYDRAGYGWSDPAPKPRSMQDRADELDRVLTAAREPGPYVLVGHSYGGFLIRLFAAKHPAKVRGMVLVDSVEEGAFFSPAAVERWGVIGPELQKARQEAKTPEQARFYDEVLDELGSNRLVPISMRHPGGFGRLGDLPLIVIAHAKPFLGDDAALEPDWRAGQQRLATLSTRGTMIVAENSGHNIQASEPELIVGAVRQVVEMARGGVARTTISEPSSRSDAADWWRGYELAPQIRLPDGRGLRLFCTGAGSPTLIMEAGLGDGAWTWRGLQPKLSRTHRICTYDRAGYGGSDPGPMPRDIDALAGDLAALLKAAKVPGPYLFVGHSLGGQIVRQVAYRHPETVAGLVLVDPAADHAFEAYAALDPEMPRAQREAYAPAARCGELAEEGKVTADTPEGRACIPPPAPEMPADLLHFHEDYARSPAHYRATLSELEEGLNGTDQKEADSARHPLGSIPIVVLTADGNLDNQGFKPAFRKRAGDLWLGWHEDMAHLSTQGTHRVVQSTSHYIQNDQPQAVLAAIEEVSAAVGSKPPTN